MERSGPCQLAEAVEWGGLVSAEFGMISTLVHIVLGGVALLILGVVGYVTVRIIRRKVLDQDLTSASAGGFTLLDFKRMYENGELTEEEYLRIKAKSAARMKEQFLPSKAADLADPDSD
ncbi:MAG: SHOCT domain-containing protein [Phycisphaerae bacterium]|nr:SHOCT domain-containing protein [Phycisphaerae bacterium]